MPQPQFLRATTGFIVARKDKAPLTIENGKVYNRAELGKLAESHAVFFEPFDGETPAARTEVMTSRPGADRVISTAAGKAALKRAKAVDVSDPALD